MRVLIVRLSSLGDVVHAAPVLADIRRERPSACIDWVAEEAFVPLLGCFEGIDRIVPIALRRWQRAPARARPEIAAFWHQLRAERYDAVIDLQGLVKSAVVTRSARLVLGGRRFGLANRTDGSAYEPAARWAYTQAVPMPERIHVVDRSRQLVATALGYAVPEPLVVPWRVPPMYEADIPWADPAGVLLAHASAKAEKLLPGGYWIDIGVGLAQRGASVLLPWGSDVERERADAIARGINAQATDRARVLPRLRLDRVAAVMSRLRGCIGLDTGLSHMAATLGLPTVQLFIEDKSWRAGAYWQPRTAIVQGSESEPPTVEQALAAWARVA